MKQFDIVIVGGGMVGLALAAQLKGSGLSIAIVDPKPVATEFPIEEYDLRVSAITRASEQLFKNVGAWSFISENEKSAYKKMFIWDGESTQGQIEFDANSIAQENLGHIIENRVLRRALFQSIQHESSIALMFGEKCQQVAYQDDNAELTLDSGKVLSAQLLVAADGALSWLREQSDIELQQKAYGHSAIVATLKTEKPHQAIAYQRFDTKGPLAFLPLPDQNYCSIVWSVEQNLAKELLALDEKNFVQQLQNTFESKLGLLQLESQRLSFPLFERTAETNIKHRLALIGDAAHTIHPLAGQGVNLGFADAKELANNILASKKKNKDIGLRSNLRSFQRNRASDVLIMRESMAGFKTLFEKTNPVLQMLRSLGMQAFNKIPAIKQTLIKKALGL